MKKRAIAILLALVMALGLAPAAALAASGQTTFIVKINVKAFSQSVAAFQLQHWEFQQTSEGSWGETAVKSEQVENWESAYVFDLPLGTVITITADGYMQSGNVTLMAWSDPDGDGIYDQRIIRGACGDGEVLPVTVSGPLADYSDPTGELVYGNAFEVWNDNHLVFANDSAGQVPSVARLSASFLTQLYGPNTLLQISLYKGRDLKTGEGVYEYYYFLLTGEQADPSNLETEQSVAITNGGAVVSKASWAVSGVSDAEEHGLVPGSLYGMDLTGNMTRAEFAAVAVKLYEAMSGKTAEDPGQSPFTDLSGVGGWEHPYAHEVREAYALNIVEGSGSSFSPDGTLTRQEAATMLARVYEAVGGTVPAVAATSFADNANVSSWARNGVEFMKSSGVSDGVGGNNFGPKQSLTIQEAIILAERMLEALQ